MKYWLLGIGALSMLLSILIPTATMRQFARFEKALLAIGITLIIIATIAAVMDPASWADR
jgi:hypothetical protein